MADSLNKCRFCQELEFLRGRDMRINEPDLLLVYKVSMVRCSIWKGRLKGQVTCKPVKLVFCPQCGKRFVETRGGVKNDS